MSIVRKRFQGLPLLIVLAAIALMAVFAAPIHAKTSEYRLSPGDVISFDFLDDAEVPVALTVTSDGNVQFPLLGDVRIVGMTSSEALEKLKALFKERDILKNPQIALNITTLRPIFVLGEVKNPGSFAYFAGMTVEQAIGLAGGVQTAASNPSDRIMARARLRGEIDGAQVEIVHEAIYAARLAAQLEGRDTINLDDVPAKAKPFLKDVSIASIQDIEQKILDKDLETSKAQISILSQGIVEAETGLKTMLELEKEQKQIVELNMADLKRVSELRQKELNTATELLRAKSSASNERARLLEIVAELSRSRRELGRLKLDLAKLQADREKDILLKIQERSIAIEKLLSARKAAEEQFFLLAAVANEEAKTQAVSFNYQVRRDVDGKSQSIQANLQTEILPGDVISISIAGM